MDGQATTKGFGSSRLAVVSATFSGAGRGVLAEAPSVDAAGDDASDESGSEPRQKISVIQPTVMSVDFLRHGYGCHHIDVTDGGVCYDGRLRHDRWLGARDERLTRGVPRLTSRRAFSMEAATVLPIEVEPKPASQAKTQLARAEPARALDVDAAPSSPIAMGP